MTNPITPQRTIRLAVPAALLPPGLKPGEDRRAEVPINFARRDLIRAEWALRDADIDLSVLQRASDAPATFCGVLLFIGLRRALPAMSLDDAFDLVPINDSDEMSSLVEQLGSAFSAAMPTPEPRQQEAGEAADPLAARTTGSEPGPSPDTISG